MLTKDDFLDVRNEIGSVMQELSTLKTYRDDYKQRHIELEDKVFSMIKEAEVTLIKQGEIIAQIT